VEKHRSFKQELLLLQQQTWNSTKLDKIPSAESHELEDQQTSGLVKNKKHIKKKSGWWHNGSICPFK
jgi:hypothetical protein